MNRREALFHTITLVGGSIVGAQVFLQGCSNEKPIIDFSDDDISFLDEVAETILPATSESGGGKASRLGEFMKVIVSDCYSKEEADTFKRGILDIDQRSMNTYSKPFLGLSGNEKFDLISQIDQEARTKDNHYFSMMKDLTLWGYFSSEVGCKEALRWNPIPGRYEACIPYNNEPAWAG